MALLTSSSLPRKAASFNRRLNRSVGLQMDPGTYAICIPSPVVCISVSMVERHGSSAETERASVSHRSIFKELDTIFSEKRQTYMKKIIRTKFLRFLILIRALDYWSEDD